MVEVPAPRLPRSLWMETNSPSWSPTLPGARRGPCALLLRDLVGRVHWTPGSSGPGVSPGHKAHLPTGGTRLPVCVKEVKALRSEGSGKEWAKALMTAGRGLVSWTCSSHAGSLQQLEASQRGSPPGRCTAWALGRRPASACTGLPSPPFRSVVTGTMYKAPKPPAHRNAQPPTCAGSASPRSACVPAGSDTPEGAGPTLGRELRGGAPRSGLRPCQRHPRPRLPAGAPPAPLRSPTALRPSRAPCAFSAAPRVLRGRCTQARPGGSPDPGRGVNRPSPPDALGGAGRKDSRQGRQGQRASCPLY